MPLPDSRYLQQPSSPQVTLDFGTPPSPTSSFEEVSYPSSWGQHHPHHHQHSLEEEALPLHNMEPRRRNVAHTEKSGWISPTSPAGRPRSPGAAYLDQDDSNMKGAHAKIKSPFNPGLPPPTRQRRVPPPENFWDFVWQNTEHIPPLIYTLLSCFTRFYKIGLSDVVVWDEAHFGKFGSHYLKREFYFDVHPPLGKMLVGLAGLLSGYDGSFEFKSGERYPDTVPYVAMRVMLALFGAAMVPLGWYTAVELGMSSRACHLVTLMVLLDCAWLCISRFILLDSMLLFFTFTTVYCMAKYNNQHYRSFSFEWWFWLCMTGWSIGCVASVKWVGLFVTALVGMYTVEDLWEKFGDLKMPVRTYFMHWVARAVGLIVIPALVYMGSFKLHFMILNQSGPGDAQMSSLFQANLEGNDFAQNPLEIAYGSKVTLKNMGFGGGLLHSHIQAYPVGSLQQQVTCYHYKDDNNNWDILPRWEDKSLDVNSADIRFVHDGDIMRLSHAATTRNLHSHTVAAPVTSLDYEVAGYGNSTVGDRNDYWKVEVVDDLNQGSKHNVKTIHSLTTRMRFKHVVLGCYLKAANSVLPQWGFKQIEVSCDKENNPGDVHTYWNVESHWNSRLPPGEVKQYRSPFLRDFWHLNVAMMTSNNALVPDPDKDDILASLPSEWPWMHAGLRMCGWGNDQIKYYLLGNPIVWWGGSVSLLAGIFAFFVYLLRMQRQYKDWEYGEWEHFLYVGKVGLFGWILHYVPFLIMGRVTYVHHYLPTLWFSVIMLGHVIDTFVFTSRKLSERTKWIVFGVFSSAVIGTFWWFKGIAFGIDGPIKEHWGLLWRDTWNIYESR